MIKLPLFRKKKKSSGYFLALDIGTEAVKTLIFKVELNKIIILGAAIESFDRFGVFDTRNFEIDVIKRAVLKSIKEVNNQSGEKADSLILGLPGNILRARICFQPFQREHQKKIIDKKEKKHILEKVFQEAKKKISWVFTQRTGILPDELLFLNTKILQTKIDGYDVPSILGLAGKDIEFRILATFLPQHYFENFTKILRSLGFSILRTGHEAENLSKLFLKEKELNANFIDIGGDLTHFFSVKNGRLEEIDELEGGGNTFSQSLSLKLGLGERTAKELKEQHSKGLLSEGAHGKIKETVLRDAQKWLWNLKERIAEKHFQSRNIFLFGGGSLLPEIQEVLKEDGQKVFSSSEFCQIKLIYPKDLPNLKDQTGKLNSPETVPVLLLCYHASENL